MVRKIQFLLTLSCILMLISGSVFAQRDEMKRGPFSPTIQGSTGLVTIFTADTLRRGEFAVSVSHHNYDRDPGDIDVNVNPVTITYGLLDRLEFFAVADVNQSVHSDGKRVPPPADLGVPAPPWRYRFYHDFPFQNRSFANGMGDLQTGLKLNILSEERGNPFGLALRGFIKLPSARGKKWLKRGRGTGEVDGGFDLILSKNVGLVGTHYNMGVTFVGDPGSKGKDLLDLRDELRLGFGFNVPTTGRLQGIFEINNTTFIGGGTPLSGPVNPVDLFGGLRFYPRDWVSVGGGYRYFLNSTDSDPASGTFSKDHNGYTVQLSFQRRKNSIPVLQCDVQMASILDGDNTQVTALGTDADYNATLDYKWSSTGGRIEGDGRNVTFHAENVRPGVYTVTVILNDNRGATVSCSKDITVLKRNAAPTVRLEPKTAAVVVGQSVRVRAIASDPNGDKLTYEWTIAGERVASVTDEVVFGSAGRRIGNYSIAVRVSDGELAASDTATVTLAAPPNKPPTVRCSVEKGEVMAGEQVNVTAQGSDPDNDPLSYQWSATAGRVEGTGAQVTFDTTGLSAGTYVITVRVSDGKGGTANNTCSVHVRERIRILIDKLKVDNVGKAILDDVALKLRGDSRIQAIITGYSDDSGKAKAQETAAMARAQDVKKYLVEKGRFDSNRLSVRSGGSSNPVAPNTTPAGRRQNRRAEIELYIP